MKLFNFGILTLFLEETTLFPIFSDVLTDSFHNLLLIVKFNLAFADSLVNLSEASWNDIASMTGQFKQTNHDGNRNEYIFKSGMTRLNRLNE